MAELLGATITLVFGDGTFSGNCTSVTSTVARVDGLFTPLSENTERTIAFDVLSADEYTITRVKGCRATDDPEVFTPVFDTSGAEQTATLSDRKITFDLDVYSESDIDDTTWFIYYTCDGHNNSIQIKPDMQELMEGVISACVEFSKADKVLLDSIIDAGGEEGTSEFTLDEIESIESVGDKLTYDIINNSIVYYPKIDANNEAVVHTMVGNFNRTYTVVEYKEIRFQQ